MHDILEACLQVIKHTGSRGAKRRCAARPCTKQGLSQTHAPPPARQPCRHTGRTSTACALHGQGRLHLAHKPSTLRPGPHVQTCSQASRAASLDACSSGGARGGARSSPASGTS